MKRAAAIILGITLGVAVAFMLPAWASRNSGGTYSLPSGNPVVSGQTISSTWANNTLSDLATEITSSLDRSGRGGMLAALRGIDGTAAAPALSFTSDTNTGLYRAGADDVRMSAGGGGVAKWTAHTTSSLIGDHNLFGTNSTLSFNLTFDGTDYRYDTTDEGGQLLFDSNGALLFKMASSGTAAAVATLTERLKLTNTGTLQLASGGLFGVGGTPTYPIEVASQVGGTYQRWKASSRFPMAAMASATSSGFGFNLTFDGTDWKYDTNAAGVAVTATTAARVFFQTAASGTGGDTATVTTRASIGNDGLTIGATGTPISASYGATYVIDFPNIATSGVCSLSAQTLTGVSPGGVCTVSPDADLGGAGDVAALVDCHVSAADTVQVRLCNLTGGAWDQGSGNFRVRVFQP